LTSGQRPDPHLDSISSLQVERARQVVPSATFLNTGATRRGFGPACIDAVVCRAS